MNALLFFIMSIFKVDITIVPLFFLIFYLLVPKNDIRPNVEAVVLKTSKSAVARL